MIITMNYSHYLRLHLEKNAPLPLHLSAKVHFTAVVFLYLFIHLFIYLLAPAVTVGETEGAKDSASVSFYLFFCL